MSRASSTCSGAPTRWTTSSRSPRRKTSTSRARRPRGGDRGLELHEFFEFLVLLGFNPEYGEQGSKYAAKLDARQVLTMLLDTLILKNVKKNGLVSIKAEILASAEIKALFKKYEKPLYKEWNAVGNGKGPMKVERKEVLSMEMFCEEMG
jgi:hypothetical protein